MGVLKRIILTLCVALFFFSYAYSFAEDFYIKEGGSNAFLVSSSCSTNYMSPAFFNTASNWQTSKTANKIGAGDTVHLCGIISTPLTVQASGTSGNKITIKFEDDAKLSKPSWNGIALNTNSKQYLIIDGGTNGIIENTDTGTLGFYNYQQNAQGIWALGCNYCEIKNLNIQNIYRRTSASDTTPSWSQSVCAWLSGTNLSFHDNICHDSAGGVIYSYNDGDDNVRIYNNEFYNNGHNFTLSSGGDKHAGKIYYYNNYAHDYAAWDGSGCPYHNSAIHAYGVGSPWPDVQEFWIYNNKFENPGICSSGHIFLEGNPQSTGYTPWTGSTGTAYFFNNIVKGAAVTISNGQNHIVANNAFITSDISLNLKTTTNPIVKNNYFSGTSMTFFEAAASEILTPSNVNNNIYANATGYNLWCWPGKSCTGNFTTYKTNCAG